MLGVEWSEGGIGEEGVEGGAGGGIEGGEAEAVVDNEGAAAGDELAQSGEGGFIPGEGVEAFEVEHDIW